MTSTLWVLLFQPLRRHDPNKGKLRIGDDWNAITIIALSQSNPLKAVAQGLIDAGYLNLTPGIRSGVIHDQALDQLRRELEPVEIELTRAIEAQQHAVEEKTSREVLRSIQTAPREVLLALPEEEDHWFELRKRGDAKRRTRPNEESEPQALQEIDEGLAGASKQDDSSEQLKFSEHAGPLFSVRISPASTVVAVGQSRSLQALARDRSRRRIEDGVAHQWEILAGEARMEPNDGEMVEFHAPSEPGLVRVQVTASQAP